jgi:hypothetical protein
MAIPVIPTEEGFVLLTIEDQGRRLNLNRLVNAAGKADKDGADLARLLEELLAQLGAESPVALVDSLIDWLDADDQITGDGAEENYYRSLDPPVEIANRPFLSIAEIGLVKGFEDPLLLGTEETPGLLEFVTVFGDGRLNINTLDADPAQPAWIITSLGGVEPKEGQEVDLDDAHAEDWRAARAEEPFGAVTQLKARDILDQTEYNAVQPKDDWPLTTHTSHFTIRATGAIGKTGFAGGDEMTQRTITAVVERGKQGDVKIIFWREE